MATATKQKNETERKPCCGLVMPISSIDGCNEQHWVEVKAIIKEAVESAGYTANLVSKSEEISVIQKTIIQNLYENPIVICDVSGKNPNVMFELGIRLAFDKPTIVIKDDATDYSFDTGSLLHLEYPRSLRYEKINIFKKDLKDKILATMKKANEDSNYSPFLKSYGSYKVAKLETTELPQSEYIMSQLNELKSMFIQFQRNNHSFSFASKFNNQELKNIEIVLYRNGYIALTNAFETLSNERSITLHDPEFKNLLLHEAMLIFDTQNINISDSRKFEILESCYLDVEQELIEKGKISISENLGNLFMKKNSHT